MSPADLPQASPESGRHHPSTSPSASTGPFSLEAIEESARRGLQNLTSLQGKVCVIAGGAGDLGATSAMALAHAGADLVVASRRLERCESIADMARKLGRQASAFQL